MEQINKQIAAAQIRLAIAQQDLQNQVLQQIKNANAVDDFMHSKFTNQDLYDWMVSQISSVYFQSYQLAYDLAKRAERAYRFELGSNLTATSPSPDTTFIQFGYWDNLKKGLLAGEKLHYDLKRMEAMYLEQNKREYEITKQISLAMLDPVALVKLKETGECFVDVPEVLFDLDYPGQYMRRIKSVSLTIPCVTGPYTSVNCTLTLLRNSVRSSPTLNGGAYTRDVQHNDPRFADSIGAVQSIVTSNGQNDSGLFEVSFRDERYLPFEYAGAISQWHIELPKDTNQIDFSTITDVILQMRYTARDGGGQLKAAARAAIIAAFPKTGVRLFSAKYEFSNDWYRFLHPTDNQTGQLLALSLVPARFPFQLQG